MTDPQLIEWLRQLRGVEREYFDFRGQHHRVSDTTLQHILAAFGHTVEDDDAVRREAEQVWEKGWRRVLPPVVVLRSRCDMGVAITVLRPLLEKVVWRVTLEDGGARAGEASLPTLPVLGEQALDNLHFARLVLTLPDDLPVGYHQLRLDTDQGELLDECRLIVAPERCFEPESMRQGQRLWGLSVQLYSLRSRRNWGIGDFTDLTYLIRGAAALGADVVGLNPLHALFPADPGMASPYSPSSRQFLNPLYLDPEAVPEFGGCPEALQLVGSTDFQTRLAALRDSPMVDYAGVAAIKDRVLWILFRHFERQPAGARFHDFESFMEGHGRSLKDLCTFYVLQEQFDAVCPAGNWKDWPAPFHDRTSDSVRAFADRHRDRIRYHMYLQWLASEQLAAAEHAARDAGMKIGLYRDLAVGVSGGGAEAWADQDLYTPGASIGAPPDALALKGQDWGIPPMRPDILKERRYQPFINLLRANMGHGGALRIDHVMLLHRLWWVPAGRVPAEGTYVHYDLEAMMGILALESHRHECLVVGEDLGTVPDAIRHAMQDFGVYSYRVFYFEDDDGMPRRPENYPEQALVTISTHDLPTLASFWRGSDIELRDRLGLYPDDRTANKTWADRRRQCRRIATALDQAGLCESSENLEDSIGRGIDAAVAEAIQMYLARSRAKLMVVQPEDWLYMEDPVNVPGTSDEYPNWRRKLVADLEDWLARDDIRRLAEKITAARGTASGQ